MGNDKACLICVVFNDKYDFDDILLIGVTDKLMVKSLLMDDILRLLEDFGDNKCEIEYGRSEYDEAVIIVHTKQEDNEKLTMHWHYYCLFDKKEDNEENEHADKR